MKERPPPFLVSQETSTVAPSLAAKDLFRCDNAARLALAIVLLANSCVTKGFGSSGTKFASGSE